MQTQSALQSQPNSNNEKTINEKLSFMDKEMDMGFFNHHFFETKEGVIVNMGCQRISKCGCDCNHCSWGVL